MLNAYHQCNQRQLGIKTATDQRHKVGDKRPFSALSLPTYLSGLETKNVFLKTEKTLKGSITLLIFLLTASNRELCHDSFQYSTNKNIRTENNIFPCTGSCG